MKRATLSRLAGIAAASAAALAVPASAGAVDLAVKDILNAAGIVAWVFAGLGGWVFMCVADVALGGKGLPLGPVLRKPAE